MNLVVIASGFLVVVLGTAKLASGATPATPNPETVVVVASDKIFRKALRAALAPTGMRIITATDESPAAAELSVAARQIAEREGAASVVWLVSEGAETTIVAYDHEVNQALIRSIGYELPFTATEAAAAARTVRTMLRELWLAPELDLPLPAVVESRAVRVRLEAQPVAGIRSGHHQRFGVSFSVAVRGGRGDKVGFERTLGALWRPNSLGLGLYLGISTPNVIQRDRFNGTIRDNSLTLFMHAPILAGRRLLLRTGAGLAVHAIELDGELDGLRSHLRHFDPAVSGGLTTSYRLTTNVDVGFTVSADALLLRQRYVVGVAPVVAVSRFQLSAGLVFTLCGM